MIADEDELEFEIQGNQAEELDIRFDNVVGALQDMFSDEEFRDLLKKFAH